ncbi:MAG TPA: ATP-dependent DNA helicase RecG [Nitrospiria bacterium]|nr:ATP-dependent DNA helicase RecG [Nitrospiria bacterium]
MDGEYGFLRIVLDRLKKPIEYACRDAFAHLLKVHGLPIFVEHQITTALTATGRPAVQRGFLQLRQLFKDFDTLPLQDRQARLIQAREQLQTLEALSNRTLDMEKWEQPVQYLKGIGPRRAELLGRLGVRTLEELLYFLPWRYEDRSRLSPIRDLVPNVDQTIDGVIQSIRSTVTHRRRFRIVEVLVGDDTGSIVARWFNQPYLGKLFKSGQRVMLSGKVKINSFHGYGLELENPIYELLEEESPPKADQGESASGGAVAPGLHTGRIVPIYHETRGLTSRQIRTLIRQVLDDFSPKIPERLPASMRETYRFPSLSESLERVHFPSQEAGLDALSRFRTDAHQRLIFDEFLLLQLGLGLRRKGTSLEAKVRPERVAPNAFQTEGRHALRFLSSLPYHLTAAQKRVLEEIKRDMAGPHPMNRLLQGDVGCGKTVVAVAAMAISVDNGYQAALMTPTEILAEQHYLTVKQLVKRLGLSSALLIQGLSRRTRLTVERGVAEGIVDLVVGTHALIQEGVRFHKLGLAIIDEQHKFGVMQRASLTQKGYHPDVLVMTATPIPRTLALSVYGDLDLSVIDEMPQGRGRIKTRLYRESQRSEAYGLIDKQIREGRQAYVVYPLVEESEKTDLKAAVKMAQHLQQEVFPRLKVGLLHGRMKTEEKEHMMEAFKRRKVQVLVATTVVEVGLDIPNATVMLVEHADRFGLAQLHQLRGRVGRGPHPSYCLLMAGPPKADSSVSGGSGELTGEAQRRLEVLVRSHDGFVIAEEDLKIRGPGEFFGTRQSGLPELRVASILRDAGWLSKARSEAQQILKEDPSLTAPDHIELREAVYRKWKDRLDLSRIG